MDNTSTIVTIILSTITIIIALVGVYYSREACKNKPKIIIESPYNDSLEIRNIGDDIARNIKEKSNLLKDIPGELFNYTGPIDYPRVKSPGISKTISFQDSKVPKPSTSTLIEFEYENTDGNRFYSQIMVNRNKSIQQIYFSASRLIKWGRL